ncbi:heme exporter protein CcmD [Devosia sp. Root685]|uniref:heme exporter protein CcmD n=1 Tax=Devosia sp. Root685 TaxID=1736587 RepID=UPI0009EB3CA7|nr:heme exporter protein CcmD [Devosia sp. Root685]
MIALGAHAEFIISAYAGVFLGLAALIGWTVLAARQTKRRLEELGDNQRSNGSAQ